MFKQKVNTLAWSQTTPSLWRALKKIVLQNKLGCVKVGKHTQKLYTKRNSEICNEEEAKDVIYNLQCFTLQLLI